jgi:hypothetical protein
MRSRRALGSIAAGLLLTVVAVPAGASEEMLGPRALGMGGALRAASAAEAGPYVNPAGMSLIRSYQVEALYELRPQDSTNAVGLSITDSATSKAGVAAGIYYDFLNADPHVRGLGFTRRGHEVGLSVSYPLADRFILGVTNKYFYVDTTGDGISLAGARSRGWTMDVGSILKLSDAVTFGVVGQNLMDMKSWEAPETLAFGLAVGASNVLVLDFDAVIRWLEYPGQSTKTIGGYHVGGEYFLAGSFPLRLGYSYDSPYRTLAAMTDPTYAGKGESFFHGGVGYVTPSFGLEFGIRQQLTGPSGLSRETLMAFGLKLFVQ